jgi:hypothetical protein
MRKPEDLTELERADMVYHCFGKEGVRGVAPMYGLETSSCFRQISRDVRMVAHFLDHNLYNGKLHVGNRVYPLDFGDQWQSDGKVIRVTKTFAEANPVYRKSSYATPTGGTVILYDIYNENVIEKRNHNILASWYLPSNKRRYISKTLEWAVRVAGFEPDSLEVDNRIYGRIVRELFQGRVLVMVLIKKGEVGELKLIEGFHLFQDGKVKSGIHGRRIAILDGLRIHYNFCSRKDKLKKLTPMESAGLPRLDDNMWRPLLLNAIEYCKTHPVLPLLPWVRSGQPKEYRVQTRLFDWPMPSFSRHVLRTSYGGLF